MSARGVLARIERAARDDHKNDKRRDYLVGGEIGDHAPDDSDMQ
jgi:hypothetical protein